ncbi:P-loop containing nucleoside triphosphate hydrolase protein [Dacryopinax primogenitus]|uniref:DNA helicase n=1 Tax=Dacryopinax primogenitus (strain DJM 731) TaxID=1858805 RepID=M5G5G2_DACPD|nr:P-loop containing nucleoside triphosphate hydrolase protein [Dacryopinax primogenitus]EJU01057.1 P-loop containing nucleoside triphosphate hydrolase protein [Dacryopinax primogenitus]
MRRKTIPTPEQLSAFLTRQRELLAAERAADIERTSLLFSKCSPKLLEQRGLALGGLGVAGVELGLGGKSLVELERPTAYHTSPIFFSPHTFRPGDLARIDQHVVSSARKPIKGKKATNGETGETGKAVEGVVYRVSDTKIVIAIDGDRGAQESEDLDLPERCRVLKLANTVTYDRMDKAIDALERLVLPASGSSPAVSRLVEILLGIYPPSPPVPVTDLQFMDPSLNLSQKNAVRAALQAPEVALIHGPPGTGKTHTLVEIIRQLVAKEQKVLVCGASNLAVDNLLERLVPHGIPVTRLGHPARVLQSLQSSTLDAQTAASDESQLAKDVKADIDSAMSALAGKGKARIRGAERKKMWDEVKGLRKEWRKREGGAVKAVMGRAKVVLSTCHGAGSRQLQNSQFDVVIIDEATQAMEAVCWIPILKAKKLILAGDPLQLPPTVLSLDSENSPKKTTPKEKKESTAKTETPSEPLDEVTLPESDDEELEEESDDAGADSEEKPAASEPSQQAERKAEPSSKKICRLRLPHSLEVTLFDRVERMFPRVKKMLTVQYRMHAIICQFPSTTLYRSKLKSHESVAAHLLRDLPTVSKDDEFSDVVTPPVVFFDTAGCEFFERTEADGLSGGLDEGSKSNENEGAAVQRWVQKLVMAGVAPGQIAVITPYQAQVTYLTSLLRADMPDLEIGTVDGMQGREKEAVVLSLVRSNDKREVGFLREKRRLNVAMTRPRRHLCVVGDSETVSQGGTYLKNWMAWLEQNADVRYGGDET